ncbi:MAG: hypothetical protein QME51_06140 [Planctomycetota bacterium]|nr:hypothetical protein [Planctomycetota bacterium]
MLVTLEERVYKLISSKGRLNEIELAGELDVPILLICEAITKLLDERKIKRTSVYEKR